MVHLTFKGGGISGFSIDVMPELETLISCGVIPLKVAGLQGPSLIFLKLCPGYCQLTNADPWVMARGPNDTYIRCIEPPAPGDGREATLQVSKNVNWIKVLGLYDREGMKFR
jgi:hypothetical protein